MERTQVRSNRARFYVEREGWATQASILFMLLSAVFRLIGCWGLWNDSFFAATQIILPLASSVLFILFVLLFGRRWIWPTALPVLAGVVFFIIKATTFDSWIHMVLCILLYLLVAILYVGTVFGVIRTKWLLAPLFGLPFLYHVFVEDLAALRDSANPVTFAAGMQEISVLCVMLALFFIGIAMKKKKIVIEGDLPRIKDPKVLPPERLRKQTEESPEEDKPAASENAEDTAAAEAADGQETSETTEEPAGEQETEK